MFGINDNGDNKTEFYYPFDHDSFAREKCWQFITVFGAFVDESELVSYFCTKRSNKYFKKSKGEYLQE